MTGSEGAQSAAVRRRIAYVLPVYDEEAAIAVFHETLLAATETRPDLDFEFVYVDDGSRDDSLARLLKLREDDDRVAVLSLSRNFGHQVAVTAGLDACVGADAVVVMDTDLQDPPHVSIELVEMWEGGVDVVFAQRRSRRDSRFKRASAFGFYWLLDRMASIEIPRNVGDFRLMDRRVVAEVTRYREQDRFLRGIVAHVGFRQEAVLFDRDPRYAGSTGYPLRKMLSLAASGIVGFSTAPLRWISRLGFGISFLSVLLAMYVFYVRVFRPEESVPGWAFLGVGMFLLSGLQLIMMGVIGTYLGRVYIEAQDRPLYSLAMTARGRRGDADRGNEVRNDPRP
ncbi:MAG: glycosyltransferase family 2 protein [Nocardioides sp.]